MLVAKIVIRQPPEFAIEDRYELIECFLVSVLPLDQQTRGRLSQ